MGPLIRTKALLTNSYRRAARLLVATAAPAEAQTVARYSTAARANPVSDTATPCTNPLKRTINVTGSFVIADVNISVLIAYTYRQDLQVNLVSPSNARVIVVNRIGGGADNINSTLDDQVASNVSNFSANDTTPYHATFIPSAALSAFNGQQAGGVWTLEVCDAAQATTVHFIKLI